MYFFTPSFNDTLSYCLVHANSLAVIFLKSGDKYKYQSKELHLLYHPYQGKCEVLVTFEFRLSADLVKCPDHDKASLVPTIRWALFQAHRVKMEKDVCPNSTLHHFRG